MFRTLFLIIFSFIIAEVFEHFFGDKGEEKIERAIVRQGGVIGCLSKDSYDKIRKFHIEKQDDLAKELLTNHQCFLYKNGEVVESKKKLCPRNGDMNKIELFSTKRFLFGRIYLPCFAFYEN